VAPLRALVGADFDVALVVSAPDRRRGRGGARSPTPVKAAAVELGLPVSEDVDDVVDAGADLGVVVAFGRLVRPRVLARLAMVNLHFSLLPRWRGAAPVERAILAGDAETGVCLMGLEEGLDTGPVHACARVAIGVEETAPELRARLSALGTDLLVGELRAGLSEPVAQSGEPTYAEKLRPGELELAWDRPAVELHRVVRLGGAWTTFRGRRLKVLAAHLSDGDEPVPGPGPGPGELDGVVAGTGRGALTLVTVGPEGRAPQPAESWRHGARPAPGERLGQ